VIVVVRLGGLAVLRFGSLGLLFQSFDLHDFRSTLCLYL